MLLKDTKTTKESLAGVSSSTATTKMGVICQFAPVFVESIELISERELPYDVQIVKIYLSSATFDEIEKEMKVKTKFSL